MTTYPTYKLGEIVDFYSGYGFPKNLQGKKTGKYPFYKVGDISKNVQNGFSHLLLCDNFIDDNDLSALKGVLLPESTLVFAKIGEALKLNRRALTKELCLVDNNVVGIKAKTDKCLDLYLFYYFKTIKLEKYSRATTVPSVRKSDIELIPIPLPPLATQHQIVSRIETLFAELDKAVQHLCTAQQQIKTYRQAVLKAAFEGCDKFEKIIKHFDVTGGLTKNSQREKFPVKMPYLRVANVYYNRLDLSEIKEIGVQESEIKEKLLKKDDLLFVEGNGSKEQIGRVAIWNGSIENCLHQNHIIKGRPLGTTLSKFALYYFISDFGREQIIKVASSTSGLYTLSTEKVRNLNVPACSISEQQRIVAEIESRLSQAEAVEASIERALQQAEALRHTQEGV